MIKLIDIKDAVEAKLKTKYGYKTYGHEVVKGYSKPSFFVNLLPKTMSNEGRNFKKYGYTVMLTYFQDKTSEIDNLQKVDELKELFGYHLSVGDRKIAVTDFDFEFVGEFTNILQFSAEIEYYEAVDRTATQPVAGEIILNEEKR